MDLAEMLASAKEEGIKEGRADGAREFAEWLSNTNYVTNNNSFILPLKGKFTIDDVVSEWEKEQKNVGFVPRKQDT